MLKHAPSGCHVFMFGLGQQAFSDALAIVGPKLDAINVHHCPRVFDLTPLESARDIKCIKIRWNQNPTGKLWDLSAHPHLDSLSITEFSRPVDYSPLKLTRCLKKLYVGDDLWVKAKLPSIDDLLPLPYLEVLCLGFSVILDKRIAPMIQFPQLKTLNCSSNLFTREQCAWLRARFGPQFDSWLVKPFHILDNKIEDKDVLIMGKRGKFYNSVADEEKIDRAVKEFEDLVAHYESDPSLLPD